MNNDNAHLYLPFVQALADGKTIQSWKTYAEEWKDLKNPQFTLDPDRYRIKPWTLPTPPEGKEWHRTDGWREEWLQDGWRPLLKGENIHEGDEGTNSESPPRFVEHITCRGPATIGWSRTRRPLPVEPKMVALGPEDVPPGSAIKSPIDCIGWFMVTQVDTDGVWYLADGNFTRHVKFDKLVQGGVILRPGQSDWAPCSKEAVS